MEEDSWVISEGLLSLDQPSIDADPSFPLGYFIGFGDNTVWLELNHNYSFHGSSFIGFVHI